MKKRLQKKLIPLLLTVLCVVIIMTFSAFNSFAAATKAGNEAALFSAVAKGGEIQLSKNIAITDTLVIENGKTVTLDLNGYTVSRGQSTITDNGSVIKVESGAVLVIKDTGYKNYGKITGGFAYNGGGIVNYGEVTLEGGTITANKALDSTYGNGGGIYNGDGAVLNLQGGVIEDNRARCGGGVYNATGGTVNIEQGSYKVTELSQLKTYYTNVSITNNKASADGSGIYNAAQLNVKDSPILSGNFDDKDIYIAYGKVMTFVGKVSHSAKIGVSAAAKGVAFTKDYTKYISKTPGDFFKPLDTAYTVRQTDKNGEAMLWSSSKTRVEVYEGGKRTELTSTKLTLTEEYDTVSEAWDRALNVGTANNRVIITLGSDWEHDKELVVSGQKFIDIDLNGHYIKRTRNHTQKDNGGVFMIKDSSIFRVHDSNPNSKGYDGIKGGVITGGASENSGGGITVEGNCSLYIDGGTIYECTTCKDGGGILCKEGSVVELKNCRIYFCQTVSSIDRCHGGGIYAYEASRLSVHNCIIQDCYSEDYGGGIYFYGDGNYDHILILGSNKFIGNNCYDYGGAAYLNISQGTCIDKCLFSTNSSYDDGGAVYIERHSDGSPVEILIRDCQFTNNFCSDGGGAIFAECNDVVLMNDTITNNHSGIGAVWLGANAATYGYDISVAGKTIIKDNTADKTEHHGIVLNELGVTHNYIYCAGLYEGSYIEFSVNDTGNKEAVKNVSEYQKQYFHNTNGTMTFEKKEDVDATLVKASSAASVFSNGSVIAICSIIGVAFTGAVAAIVYKKKKGGADDDNSEE